MYKILQTDDNTLYLRGHDLQEIVSNLENNLCKLLEWFRNNGMVVNPKEFQLMFLGMTTNRQLRFNFEGKRVNATGRVKLLGVETESKLMFSKHVKALWFKANKNMAAFLG